MDIQAEKLMLIEWLTQLSATTLLEKIKYLKDNQFMQTDWWQDISQQERNAIDEGLSDVQSGRVHPHEEVRKRYEKWL